MRSTYLQPKLVSVSQCRLIMHSAARQGAGWNPGSTTSQLGPSERSLYFSVPILLMWEMGVLLPTLSRGLT